jgi:hypothetical protein
MALDGADAVVTVAKAVSTAVEKASAAADAHSDLEQKLSALLAERSFVDLQSLMLEAW